MARTQSRTWESEWRYSRTEAGSVLGLVAADVDGRGLGPAFQADTDGEGDGELEVAENEGVGTAGSGCRNGEPDTSGRASSLPLPSSSADIIPVTVPAATTAEASATMAPRRAARRRSARRAAKRSARRTDTWCSPSSGPRVIPRSGEATGPAALGTA
ncbi:hypothetical protein GCM10010372_32600 [Streptomyces tauricus]|nr:hypothetical protein GCM10010372_32600 [Streptomyces tauricus]